MSSFVAVLDACVLYPAPLRDLLLRLALTDLYRARWTNRIHDEWIRSLVSRRPDLSRERLQRTRALMDRTVPDCLVTGFEELIDSLDLPDPEDRHILAAAIRSQAGVIVTYNTKDFPEDILDGYGIEVQHPDEFVTHLYDLSPGAVCRAVRSQRQALKNPPYSTSDLLNTFLSLGLATTVAHLQSMEELI
ncbi:MAG: PIN domain-containing protein [Thermoanaerobaculales bacterium]|jgi:predicted nucleic acid-binding protein|nr:PIN domain-containing protein [Thermoanaerobaculales bacterium]